MNKLYKFFSLCLSLLAISASAAVVNIAQTNNTFDPMFTNVNVGDVIHWEWSSGSHTTTSILVPAGAASWDEELDSMSPTFDYTVEVAGIYGYNCTYHAPGMAGGFQAAAANSVLEPVLTASTDFSAGMDNSTHTLHVNLQNYSGFPALMKLMDITGREVEVLLNAQIGTGEQVYKYDLSSQTRGMYFVRLEQGGRIVTKKVMVN